jgi:hypothetical protein
MNNADWDRYLAARGRAAPRRQRVPTIGTTVVAAILCTMAVIAGLVVLAYAILFVVVMANFGSNK